MSGKAGVSLWRSSSFILNYLGNKKSYNLLNLKKSLSSFSPLNNNRSNFSLFNKRIFQSSNSVFYENYNYKINRILESTLSSSSPEQGSPEIEMYIKSENFTDADIKIKLENMSAPPPPPPLMGSNNDEAETVIKLRGLPYSATLEDILEFVDDCKLFGSKDDSIHLVKTAEGRASGEAFVDLKTDDDMELAMKLDKKNMGHRYIEVFKVKRAEMNWVLKRNRPAYPNNDNYHQFNNYNADCFVRLRGIPFESSKGDIVQFFNGLEMVPNGISLMVDQMGRNSGEAYVQFTSKEMAEKALNRNRSFIGHRYIEVFRVANSELKSIDMLVLRNSRSYNNARPSPYDRGDRGDRGGDRGPGGRPYGGGRPGRYMSKGFEDDSWGYGGNEMRGGRDVGRLPPPPPPPPLLPNLKPRNIPGGGQHSIFMRGLPYKASQEDIRRFFEPHSPVDIHIIFDETNRPSGTAKVYFATDDEAQRAMDKHKGMMEHRWIELFSV